MATVTLHGADQKVRQHLPSCCAVCGEPSTRVKEKKFVWFPKWIFALLIVGVLPYLILVLVLRKFMTVRVPLCEKHKHPWLKQIIIGVCTLIHLLIFSWVAIIISAAIGDRVGPSNLVPLVVMGVWFAVFVILVVLVIIVANSSIRPKEITDHTITLAGVSEAFANGVGSAMSAPRVARPVERVRDESTYEERTAGHARDRGTGALPSKNECFLCGKPLSAADANRQVCSACRIE